MFEHLDISFLSWALTFSGCATGPSGKIHAGPGALDGEIAIGQKIHEQILSTFYVYTEPSAVGYVQDIGKSLSQYSRRKNLPYQFTVLYSDKIYATSAPGGFVYVTTGMISFLQNEAELAAVIAHEIGQLQYKDPKLSVFKKTLENVTKVGATVGPLFGHFGALAVLGLVAVNLVADAGEKTAEEKLQEADAKALNYLLEAGYDPQGLLDVIHRFLKADKNIMPYYYDYYQSRPISEPRFESLQIQFDKLHLDNKNLQTNAQVFQEMTKGVRQIYNY